MRLLKGHFFFLILVLFTLVYTYVNTGVRYDFWVLSLFLAIGLGSLYGLFYSIDTHPISLNKTFCLFFYFFCSIAPITQFKKDLVFFVNDKNISDSLYCKGGILLLAVLFTYLLIYRFLYSFWGKTKFKDYKISTDTLKVENNIVLIGVSLISVVFYLYLIKFNWNLLVFRPFDFKLKNNTNLGLLGYALLVIVQFIPFICLIRYKLTKPKDDKNTYALLFLMLIVCFPTALSRGVLAMLYIPLFLLYVPILNQKRHYIKMYLFGLLVAFPLFNNFRYLYEGKFNFNYQLFDTGHFDSFQNFVFLLDEKIVTNGRQLLGSIFFFVQESQWPNRPMGTGTLIAEKLGYSYTNVDMSFFGEGYANFGLFGIFIFLVLITTFNAFLDYRYATKKMNYLVLILFYVFLGFEFYLLRGDLYSSIKMLTSFLLAISFVELSCFVFNTKFKSNE